MVKNTNKHIKSIPRMFEQVTQQIIDHIDSTPLEPGQKLPTERQLSELLQVSRSSVREGIKVLELLRFLDSKQGEGTFVASSPPYMIPSRVINKTIPMPELEHYFEVALMCAKTIILSFLKSEEPLPDQQERDSFWENFYQVVSSFGKRLPNPYFHSLWEESYQLLTANQYFERKQQPFEWSELDTAIQKRDLQKIFYLLDLVGISGS
ncbi:FadR/GntR family transcriptional regulator [Brevibacillus panacihumi]|uniref:FadR family transcriptional regulator n=1 Tax=Brevibacillus panacihumi TaxID=497735 RepID=A0A3M8C1Q1_9BACL|nr:GntR family transcriptional regulator [Brevibacillus panacihumi]RNB69584.1 FadR family transcriptional regulator [Brevibacillus panacihumi]